MTSGTFGVAISTTGEEHRLPGLRQSIQRWREVLPLGSVLVVTVDGSVEEAERVREMVARPQRGGHIGGNAYRVGQRRWAVEPYDGRLGVAVNKNTGLELLMDAGVQHLFLSDDDCGPRRLNSLTQHTYLAMRGIPHSMVCWGRSRLDSVIRRHDGLNYATWTWPRGVMLYAHRSVVERVGGMVETFGPGGHEHAEWSERIHNAGFTPAPFISPADHAHAASQAARSFWEAEDIPKPGEKPNTFAARKARHTTVRTTREDWARIDRVMARQRGSSAFVPFSAQENGRASATLCLNIPSQGAES